jgi:hypothetical protein
MGNKAAITTQEKKFFTEIAVIIQKARQTAYKAVYNVQIHANWLVGRRIVEQEQKGKSRAEYGDFLIVNLSRFLTGILGEGFSEANLRNFRQFYLTFPNENEFVTHCVTNLSWTHWRSLIWIDDEDERNYYIREASEQGWNTRQLERISTETSDFYLDLVFYNYLLKCFVIIDLKTTRLSARDVGQMEMYVRMFDALKRGQDDNPTLGIILCAEKDETIVKYSVLKENKQIFASKYKTILPSEKQLAAMIEKKNAYLLEKMSKEGTVKTKISRRAKGQYD